MHILRKGIEWIKQRQAILLLRDREMYFTLVGAFSAPGFSTGMRRERDYLFSYLQYCTRFQNILQTMPIDYIIYCTAPVGFAV